MDGGILAFLAGETIMISIRFSPTLKNHMEKNMAREKEFGVPFLGKGLSV